MVARLSMQIYWRNKPLQNTANIPKNHTSIIFLGILLYFSCRKITSTVEGTSSIVGRGLEHC